ncbi:sigma-70 family RNA polymerase sigma factor [Phytoactinopolyspora halotolerans]|uniref:RNA polymerase sigma factor n=1 Tax=Phytoactinopolyspora halotolerans TaxID=1981512 RepID=A0A6L9S6L4_9ACTN|nr:sigma-70 family RNA polymerase sigma factor [Phytoactinopolyspora halotolerans]NED99639.1 sigma-70 family RNA polymerase sigma factor [Phytoactinopolyspora halotolerans]
MTPTHVQNREAATPDDGEFAARTEPFRRELLAHCYRMLGSVDEAEDLVQETYLRAWRSYGGFEGRSSLRSWLYRIATNVCLTALERRDRRPLPSGLGDPTEDAAGVSLEPVRDGVTWLQPAPDEWRSPLTADPAAVTSMRGSLRLALVAAFQHLLPRQRAVLILRDVLDWPAADVADMLGTTTTAVKSTLQRARAQLNAVSPAEDGIVEPPRTDTRELLERYMKAFENADVDGLTRLLRKEATFEMPPFSEWLVGRDAIGRFAAARILGSPGTVRMVATAANGQPAAAAYRLADDGAYRAHALHVLTATPTAIAGVVAFLEPGLFAHFGLPPRLPSASASALAAAANPEPSAVANPEPSR